jgi:hypothetical protein
MGKNTKEEMIRSIVEKLLPDASPSRRKTLERVTSSMTENQLKETMKAVAVGVRDMKVSRIRDIVESRDLLAITYISKWGEMVDLSDIEGRLSQSFSRGDSMYDVYSPKFAAHVEAYMTYHSHCAVCYPHDLDADYDLISKDFPVPAHGHYVDYLQDYDLMKFVEKNPSRVSELVRLAAERRGLNAQIVKEYLDADSGALVDGLL